MDTAPDPDRRRHREPAPCVWERGCVPGPCCRSGRDGNGDVCHLQTWMGLQAHRDDAKRLEREPLLRERRGQ